jgi:hypothetical protein
MHPVIAYLILHGFGMYQYKDMSTEPHRVGTFRIKRHVRDHEPQLTNAGTGVWTIQMASVLAEYMQVDWGRLDEGRVPSLDDVQQLIDTTS